MYSVEHDVFLLGGRQSQRTPAETLGDLVDYSRVADRSGFDTVWFAEHHFIDYGLNPATMTMASHVLAATDNINVGTAVVMLSQHHPVMVGEQVALLEALAPGRFRLGVGRGGPWVDLEVFNSSLERFESGFPEALEVLRRWLTADGDVWFAGDRFSFRPVSPVPPPPYRESDPNLMWVAATGEHTARLAGRMGLPLLLGMHTVPADHEHMIDIWRQEASAHGHDVHRAQHAAALLAQVVDGPGDRSRLWHRMRTLLGYTDQYQSLLRRGSPNHDAYVDFLLSQHAVGSEQEVMEKLTDAADASGVRRQLLFVEGMGDPKAVTDNIATLGKLISLGGPRS
ncbi:LLM class flavin-dependent oxidoreductase [Haloglycomyces albus]|uniref:LLM class flavin-dependent oxidoreductase n=1 Tax=Haloglycomyces albus TaxID=526067 RepID=UPI0004A29F3F|nr:LLM class flavin-dependent oxidoreductase [Haloglycomyces albus]